ncbi:MAG: copper homeostasis protein CutC [Terracidiphilus sp.]
MSIALEICVDSVDSAVAAQAGGADRVELCRALDVGGLTPSEDLIRSVRAAVALDVFVMIRPRSGNFVYTADERAAMLEDIERARACGADGVVLGALLLDGEVDIETSRQLIAAARPMGVTFHRAFDVSANLERSLEKVIAAGADRVLTSGGSEEAIQAVTRIAGLVRTSEGRIGIMAGGGIRTRNVRDLVLATDVAEVHTTLGFSEQCASLDWNSDTERSPEADASARFVVREADVHAMHEILDGIVEARGLHTPVQ